MYNIIKRYSTNVGQIMPLGFCFIVFTVTFDIFLRWATQGPLGPLVIIILSWFFDNFELVILFYVIDDLL